MGTGFIMAVLICNGPDNSLQTWARPIALKELEEEDAIFAAYADDDALREAKGEALRAKGRHPDRYYDAVMMRNEFDVLKLKAGASE